MDYYEPRLPCDATQIGRFRRLLGEEGLEQLLKFTIETAVEIKAIKAGKPAELVRVIVDTTVMVSTPDYFSPNGEYSSGGDRWRKPLLTK